MFIDKEGNVRKPIVYLADFEMFLPSCPETVKYWKETCERYGLIGLFPGDGDPVEPGEDRWRRVFEHDVSYMKKSDMCIAQLDDWRGHEPDSGTLFELGYFVAKGLPSYGFYGGPGQMKERKIEAEERDGVFAFLLLWTLLPQSSHFFSCHDSGNRSLSFSHACCMLMPNQLTNVIWLGKKESKPQSAVVLQRQTPPPPFPSPHSPQLPF